MFEWKYLFSDTIIQSGKGIANSAVKTITIDSTGLTATVQGSELYTVTIDKDWEKITCTCQSHYKCKHMAAVLMVCEKVDKAPIREFFAEAEDSLLGIQAGYNKKTIEEKIAKERISDEERARLEAERAERRRQWLADIQKEKAEKEEKARQAEIRRKEKEQREAEVRKRKEERERIKRQKQAEKEAQLKAQREQLEREMAEWREENRKKAEKERVRQIELQSMAEQNAAIKAEHDFQEKLDRQARRGIDKLPAKQKKGVEAELADVDERIAILEKAEAEGKRRQNDKADTIANLSRLDETGWYYPDTEPSEGVIYTDIYGKTVFVPDGQRLWISDEDGYLDTIKPKKK